MKLPSLTKKYDNWMWKLEDPRVFARAFKYNLKLRKWGLQLDWIGDCFAVTDNKNEHIFILSQHRLEKYKNGIDTRLNQLEKEYMLDQVKLERGDVVIDCGANVGEIGILLKKRLGELNYIAFEPGKPEFEVCKKTTQICIA